MPVNSLMNRKSVPGPVNLIALSLVMLLSLPLVAGFFGRVHPAFDSFAHFRVHLAVLLIVCALPMLVGALRREGLVAIAFGLAAITSVTGSSFVPGMRPLYATFAPRPDDAPVYRLLQMNLRFNNPEPEKFLSLVGRVRPDVITLDEVSDMWSQKIALLFPTYPYRLVCELGNYAGGVAILSLRPFAEGSEGRCIDGGTFGLARFDFAGRNIEIGALHMHWPWPMDQAAQLAALAGDLAGLSDNALIAGDLNAVPWSATTARIAEAGALHRIGPIGVTWLYRRLPEFLRFAGLPIDQVFAKGAVRVHSAKTLDAAGSDHLPVLVEFSVDAPPGPPSEPTLTITTALASTFN